MDAYKVCQFSKQVKCNLNVLIRQQMLSVKHITRVDITFSSHTSKTLIYTVSQKKQDTKQEFGV